ncbi:hypothetical protein ABLE68_05805 [Nocardioides sp. CN2-186]|uniref:hypothetical protein n=1 Tax=Nocardioides tweenelious TaxID=3156607 RepID=UPI0032B59D24
MSDQDLLLPENAVLLHIGPFKTGSTALQSALWARRDEMAPYGVAYPGRWRRLFGVGHALMRWAPRGHAVPDVSVWDEFAAQVRALDDVRVCLSTEDFGRLQKIERSRKIAEDLGADRLHIVYVARRFDRLLPSHWQERIKSHDTRSYDEWLQAVLLGDDKDEAHRSFWSSNDINRVASLWLDFVPAERFTVITTDDSDRALLLRVFESMLGLPDGFLTLDTNSNASLSYNATELLRRLNGVFEERGWDDRAYAELVQRGLVASLQEGDRSELDERIPPVPAWAAEHVAARSQGRIDAIRSLGLNVVGDLDTLATPVSSGGADRPVEVDLVSLDTASRAVVGVVTASLREEERQRDKADRARRAADAQVSAPGGPAVAHTSSRAMLREIGRRQWARVTRRGPRSTG